MYFIIIRNCNGFNTSLSKIYGLSRSTGDPRPSRLTRSVGAEDDDLKGSRDGWEEGGGREGWRTRKSLPRGNTAEEESRRVSPVLSLWCPVRVWGRDLEENGSETRGTPIESPSEIPSGIRSPPYPLRTWSRVCPTRGFPTVLEPDLRQHILFLEDSRDTRVQRKVSQTLFLLDPVE